MRKRFVRIIRNRTIQIILVLATSLGLGFWVVYARLNPVMPPATIHLLSDTVLPQPNQKVLIFSPHPDDETISVGGYINESVKRKAHVYIVLVTDGNKHNLKNLRYQEFKKATQILGVPETNLVFLNYPDGKLALQDQSKLQQSFKKQIDLIKPAIIIYPHTSDMHLDHATTGKVVEQILGKEKRKEITYEYIVHWRLFPQPKKFDPNLYLLPPSNMVSFDQEWQRLMLSKQVETKKEQALMAYKSQLRTPLLKSLMLSSIRRNELFVKGNHD